jgi:hypothetical protein
MRTRTAHKGNGSKSRDPEIRRKARRFVQRD